MKLHVSRSFAKPDLSLLTEIAEGTCEFGPIKPSGPIVLYGMGDMGEMAKEYCAAVGLDVRAVMDQDSTKAFRPSDYGGAFKKLLPVFVSIANYPYVPIERSLADLGFQHIAPFYDICESYRDVHPLSNGWFAEPFSAKYLANISGVYERWADDTSRAHYLQFLAWRRLREEWSFEDAPVTTDDRYFIPEVVSCLGGNEFFVDGGASDGRVTEEFLTRFGGHALPIEPEPSHKRSISGLQTALSDESGLAPFHRGLGYASQISKTAHRLDKPLSEQWTGCTRLDDIGVRPTYLKLHLEGHELAALKGATQKLERFRPILAVTAYHSSEGLWQLPLHLMDSLSDYRWLLRAHAYVGTSVVLYGIPLERTK